MTEEQEESLIGSLGSGAIGGISAIGNLLDLPGSMVRDIVSGQNPLDQLVHPFSPDNRTTGRDLLRNWGMAGNEDTYGNWWAGFGLEALMDPLTYLTFGGSALSKAGQAAKKAGVLDDLVRFPELAQGAGRRGTTLGQVVRTAPRDVVERITEAAGGQTQLSKLLDQRLGGYVGVGLPFRDPVAAFGAPGGLIEKGLEGAGAVASAPYRLATKLPGVGPLLERLPEQAMQNVVRPLIAQFDPRVSDAVTERGQFFGRQLSQRNQETGQAMRDLMARQSQRLIDAGLADEAEAVRLRSVLEGFEAEPAEIAGFKGSEAAANADLHRRYRQLGINSDDLEDWIPVLDPATGDVTPVKGADYSARAKSMVGLKGGSARVHAAIDPFQTARQDVLKGVHGGTQTLIELAQDDVINGMISRGEDIQTIAAAIGNRYGSRIPDLYYAYDAGKQELKSGRWEKLASELRTTPAEIRERGIFGNHPLVDAERRRILGHEKANAAESAIEFMAESLREGRTAGEGEAIRDVLRKLGLKIGDAANPGALDEVLRRAGVNISRDDAADFLLRPDEAKDIQRYFAAFSNPDSVKPLVDIFDSITNLTKSMFTSVWPAFASRNLSSGQFQNYVLGLASKRSVTAAGRILKGENVPLAKEIPLVRKMLDAENLPVNDETATAMLRRLAYADQVLSAYTGRVAGDVAGQVASAHPERLEDALASFPGQNPVRFGEALKKWTFRHPEVTANPLDVRGVAGRTESHFGPAAGGQDVNHFVEGLNRFAPYIEGLLQKWDRRTLMEKIKAAHADYSNRNYTALERRYLTRLFPFYKFSKSQIPFTLRMLSEKPGGAMAKSIEAQNRAHAPSTFTPDYVAETASIPVPGAPAGNERYLTGLGLAYEDPLSLVGSNPLLEIASRLNPIPKAIGEAATGQSFFQKGPEGGRPLEDMDPTIGRTLANVNQLLGGERAYRAEPFLSPAVEQIAANSPFSRLLSTVRTVTDPRKYESPATALGLGANLFSGFRINDVSPQAQDAIAREHIEQLLKQVPEHRVFENLYVPEEARAEMDPLQRAETERLLLALKVLQDRAKQRAAARELGL